VPVTRQEAIPPLPSITSVFITGTIRGHPAEVTLGPEDRLQQGRPRADLTPASTSHARGRPFGVQ
jgi:hypothetical protein